MTRVRALARAATVRTLRAADGRLNPPRYLRVPGGTSLAGTHRSAVDATVAATGVYVLHASQTGNAAYVADALATALGDLDLPVVTIGMENISVGDLAAMRHVALVCSTTGEGDLPSAAEAIWAALGDASALSSETGFTVLALGDRGYAKFCAAGREFDARLAEMGATRLLALRECDADFDDTAAAWIDDVRALFYERLGRGPAAGVPTSRTVGLGERAWLEATLCDKQRASGDGSTKEVWTVRLEIDPGRFSFQPGDGMAVLPHQPPALVEAVCRRIGASPGDVVDGSALGVLLATGRDLSRPSRRLVAHVAEATGDALLAAALEKPEHELLEALGGRDVLDLLDLAPEHAWSAPEVVELLGVLQPRVYSIASSPSADPRIVELALAVPRWERGGRERGGVCSTYVVDRLLEGDAVQVRAVPNRAFHLPDDDASLIMVGPGTGLAPFRGFLAEREARGADGRNWLFFGDRNRSTDFLYEEELLRWQASGTLTHLDLAFSRDEPGRAYVQDLMRANGAELFAWIEDGAHLYVCGDKSRMAPDVEHALVEIVAKHGGLPIDQAIAYVQVLRSENRYRQDVY